MEGEAVLLVAPGCARPHAPVPLWARASSLDTGQSHPLSLELAQTAAARGGHSTRASPHFLRPDAHPSSQVCRLLTLLSHEARLDVPEQTEGKDDPQNGEKYLQTKRTTDSSPKYTNSSHGSVSKTQKPNRKMNISK